eukprot:scaffold1863_cov85-Cylindrotheca_fusiformis.AAC.12
MTSNLPLADIHHKLFGDPTIVMSWTLLVYADHDDHLYRWDQGCDVAKDSVKGVLALKKSHYFARRKDDPPMSARREMGGFQGDRSIR